MHKCYLIISKIVEDYLKATIDRVTSNYKKASLESKVGMYLRHNATYIIEIGIPKAWIMSFAI